LREPAGLVPGQRALHYPRLRIGGAVAARRQKHRRMNAQVAVDEDCQLRYEIVAGTSVAKESAVVCVRMPPAEGMRHRTSHLQAVPATVPAIGELAAALTAVPAVVLGVDDRLGKLARGYVADAVMLDSSWTPLAVWAEGTRIS
jgi:N-acetylglucosamine-6-phosphate deacetylase